MRVDIAANRWLVNWWLAWASLCGGLLAAEPQSLVVVQRGELPIILSAPHGGQESVPGAEPRKGEGLERKPGGFVTARDTVTEELAQEVADAVALRFGKPPYSVVSKAHRKYLDPNRAPAAAYEGDAAQAVYDAYHAALEDACREVQARFHTGLLLDLHGQGSAKDTVFRGTKNGATVAALRQRFGEAAHTGEAGLWGQLKRRGWTVHPDPFDGREQPGFTDWNSGTSRPTKSAKGNWPPSKSSFIPAAAGASRGNRSARKAAGKSASSCYAAGVTSAFVPARISRRAITIGRCDCSMPRSSIVNTGIAASAT